MSRVLSSADGAMLVALARKSILSSLNDESLNIEQKYKDKFSYNSGVFIALRKFGRLRGCLGYARSAQPLYSSVASAAKCAAFQDPRYPPLQASEMSKIELEVSLLSEPTHIPKEKPSDILKNIKVGKDGIILSNNNFSGLMLPQIASDRSWSAEDFLKYTCTMLGLNEAAWLDPKSRIYKFRAKVFTEN